MGRRVIRTRAAQPDYSPGMFVAAIALLVLIQLGWLMWWTLLLVVMLVPITNMILTGLTSRDEVTIEKDL